MNIKVFSGYLIVSSLLCACGFKGDLYLPDENKSGSFAPIQTGIGITPPTPDELNQQNQKSTKDIDNVEHKE